MKALSIVFRVLSIAIYIVLIAALLVAAPMLAGYRPVVVLSPSMVPAYPVDSITYYKAADPASLNVGDAITFKIGDSLATHRIKEKNDEERNFVTKGDNNPTADSSPVSFDDVVGKTANFALPYVGYAAQYAQKHWYIIVILGAILLVDIMMPSAKSEKKEKKEKKAGNKKAAQTKGKIDIRTMANIPRMEAAPSESESIRTMADGGQQARPQQRRAAPTKQQDESARRDTPLAKMRPFPQQWR